MALVLKDRVRETSISTGTGTIDVLGAVTGYQTFGSAIGSGNTCYYTIYNQGTNEWEVGLGTVGSGTLARNTVLSSSNAGSLVNFSAGTKDVFVTYPAEKAVYEDAAGNIDGYPITGGSINGTTIGASTPAAGTFTNLAYTGTLTGGTGVVNLGSGQVYKDASGNVGIGTSSPVSSASQTRVTVNGAVAGGINFAVNGTNTAFAVASSAAYFVGSVTAIPLIFSTTDTERMRIDTSGNVGIGTSSPNSLLTVNGEIQVRNAGTQQGKIYGTGSAFRIENTSSTPIVFLQNTGTEYMRIDSSGNVGIGTSSPSAKLEVYGQRVRINAASDPGIELANTVAVKGYVFYDTTNDLVTMRHASTGTGVSVNSSGNVGIGTTNPTSPLTITNNSLGTTAGDVKQWVRLNTSTSNGDTLLFSKYRLSNGSDWTTAGSRIQQLVDVTYHAYMQFNNESISFGTGGNANPLSVAERMRIDSSGNVGIGSSSPGGVLDVRRTGASAGWIIRGQATTVANESGIYMDASNNCELAARNGSGTLTARFGSSDISYLTGGNFAVGKTNTDFANVGAYILTSGIGIFTASGDRPLGVNRKANDGTLVSFWQDQAEEGSISVSGTTVSYNGGHISRWSQLYNETTKVEVYRGTVLESVNAMCEWYDDEGNLRPNEQSTKTIVSTTPASKAVAGVFDMYDVDDKDNPYDFYVAQSGDFVIRVAAGTVVQNGDLLESAGDGTARVQADDICRSSTIAKVTSNYVSETYADGSFCVPCILMIG